MLAEKLSRISYSNLSTYLNCPRQWKLRYLDKLDTRTDTIDTVYGTAMHETIQSFLKEYYNNTIVWLNTNKEELIEKYCDLFIATISNLLNEKKESLQVEYILLENYVGFAIETLQEFIPNVNKWFPKQNIELYGIEFELNETMDTVDLSFNGYIDIILHNKKKDTYKVIDLKTSHMGWTANQKKDEVKRLQLYLYKHFFAKNKQINPDKIEIEFIILKKVLFESQYKISRVQIITPPQSSITTKKAIKFMEATIEEMKELVESGGEGEIKISNLCKWCPFYKEKELCDRRKKKK